MSTDEKNYYKSFACKLNKNRKKNYEHEQISNLLNCSFDFWTMKNDIKKKFDDMNSTGKKYCISYFLLKYIIYMSVYCQNFICLIFKS